MNICEDSKKSEETNTMTDEKYPDLIKEKLYIGTILNASDIETLKLLGITHILIFASYIEPLFPQDFIYKKIPVHDLPNFNIKDYLHESFSFIEEGLKSGSVLIHCAAAFSRSSTCVIAYLMKENLWTYDESLKFVQSRRPLKYTNPNYGFKQQLKDYEKELNLNPENFGQN